MEPNKAKWSFCFSGLAAGLLLKRFGRTWLGFANASSHWGILAFRVCLCIKLLRILNFSVKLLGDSNFQGLCLRQAIGDSSFQGLPVREAIGGLYF